MPTSPLVSVADLAAELDARPPVLLDVRWRLGGPPGADAYRDGHIPAARFVNLDTELAAPAGSGGRHPLPTAGDFEAAMRRHGLSADRPVVVYDGADSMAAARAWWLLRYFGHRDTRVLDGGLRAAVAAGIETTVDDPRPAPGTFTAHSGAMPLLDAAGAARIAATGVLLDARSGERYRGEVEPIDPVAGHIPGARSAPAAETVDAAGCLLTPAALQERFGALGVRPGVTVGAYCGSGVTAAHAVLALEVAGLPAALYCGSWSEWVSDPARPVATGADPG